MCYTKSMIKDQIISDLRKSLEKLGLSLDDIAIEHPVEESHGDYSTNIAMVQAKKVNQNPFDLAQKIVSSFPKTDYLEKIEVVKPGFINLWLKTDFLGKQIEEVLKTKESFGKGNFLEGKKIMVEFAHPNTHKELHIGHMRTLITGEALARIFAAAGAKVFRANYQGDIGPHVAKAIGE